MLDRLEREHLADSDPIAQTEASSAAYTGIKLGFVQPAGEALGGSEQRENIGTGGVDLGLKFDPIAHGPAFSPAVRCGRNRKYAQNSTDATPNATSSATSVKKEERVVSAR